MKRNLRHLAWMIAAIGLATPAANIRAETWTLQLKRLDAADSSQGYSWTDYIYRVTYPQHFSCQIISDGSGGMRVVPSDPSNAVFKKIVKKEPHYRSASPFRGVARLGTQEFAFVLDASESESEKAERAKPKGKGAKAEPPADSAIAKLKAKLDKTKTAASMPALDRLYFDFNHNGDLTDDKVVAGQVQTGQYGPGHGYAGITFPRLEVTIDAGGTRVESAILLSASSQMSSNFNYTSVQINAAAYRTGEIVLEGKKRNIVLIDFNSNGRFDDVMQLRKDVHGSKGEVYPEQGDMFLLDPAQRSHTGHDSPYDVTSTDYRYNVAKLVSIDGRFYDLRITPAGDKLTLEPSSVALGHVTNPSDVFRALIYSDAGFLKISGGKGTPVSVPEGEWKLLSYTINHTMAAKPVEPVKKEASKDPKQTSLLDALKRVAAACIGSGSSPARDAMVAARATDDYKAVKIVKGQTVVLPFGPPYKPRVTASDYGDPKQFELEMSLVGSAGELCSDLNVQDGRPGKPEFTITDTDGKVVQQGSFEYG